MFIRAKTVKGKKYAYLVENTWKRGKVKQKTKKYLGRIIELNTVIEKDSSFVLDTSKSLRECMIDLIAQELISKGFTFDNKHTLKKGTILIRLPKKPYIVSEGKNVVLLLNKRYVYPKLFEHLLDFYEPESDDDRKGEKLAFRLRDAGINISPENFVALYKKIYVNEEK